VKVTGLADWRDAALIVLMVEALLGVAVVGVVLFQGLRGLLQLIERLRPVLFEARLGTWKVCDRINHATRVVVGPFVWLHSVAEGARHVLQILTPQSLPRTEQTGGAPSITEGEIASLAEGGSR
jgi:hypothetical protein